MLDVHPPHEPVHGIRDFLLHLLTITVGLLIALGLEAGVEWLHHQHLRHEAESNIRREIEDNRKDLVDVLAAIPKEQDNFKGLLALFQAQAAGKPMHLKSATISLQMTTPQEASWQTAAATGALAYMDYGEVQKFAAAYQLQKKLDGVQDTTLQPVTTLLGVVSMGDPSLLSKPESLTAAAQVRDAIAHVETMRELGLDVQKHYDEALKE